MAYERSDRGDRGDRGSDRGDRGGDRGDRNDRFGGGDRDDSGRPDRRPRVPKDFELDYKDPLALARYITDGGKITPARILKFKIADQKTVAEAVKRARNIAILPNGSDAFDTFNRFEGISPQPFEI